MNRAGVYLDYAGAAPAPPELLKNVLVHLMTCPPQGNPHTTAAAGFSQSDVISEARLRVLAHIHADPRQYDVIFTSGATAAIKMVGEVFPNTAGSMLCYSKNSHTSILGLRHFFDHAFCLPATFVTDSIPALDGPETQRSGEYSLIATPAECNFSGFKMDIIAAANAVARMTDKSTQLASIKVGDHVAGAGTASSSWLWLLDAAKYAATSDLDISLIPSQQRPHFICLSFYKIFGYPTGLGCAVVRRDIAGLLRKGYWGGGSVDAAAADAPYCVLRPIGPSYTDRLHDLFEDGTVHFLGIAALRFGFDAINDIGGMKIIEEHTYKLAKDLCSALRRLRHDTYCSDADPSWSGQLCHIYGWDESRSTTSSRSHGSIVSFNVLDATGCYLPFSEVWKEAHKCGITLRMGCFCNVGACQEYLGISAEEVANNYETGRRCGGADGTGDVINGRPTGAIRASVGAWSTAADCDSLVSFLADRYLNVPSDSEIIQQARDKLLPTSDVYCIGALDNYCSRDISVAIQLSRIFIYPFKSCAGIRVTRWPLSDGGLYLDREWAIVSVTSGKVLTQKTKPKLAMCIPSLSTKCGIGDGSNPSFEDFKYLTCRAPGMDDVLVIDLCDCSINHEGADMNKNNIGISSVLICNQERLTGKPTSIYTIESMDQTERFTADAGNWFSRFLGEPVRVVRRRGSPIGAKDSLTNFSNEAQFLMITEASLTKLAMLMKNKVGQRVRAIPTEPYPTASTGFEPIISGLSQGSATACPEGTRGICIEDALQVSRFRPNFLLGSCAVEGAPLSRIDQEDSWRSVALESAPGIDIELEVTGPCSRCQMININQTSGVVDGRYLQTLAEYRKVGSRINFGHFLRMNPDFERQVKMSVAETIQSSANDSPEYLSAFVYEGMMVKAIL